MKKLELLEIRLKDLGNVLPSVGTELVFRGVRYLVLHVTPPPARSPRRRKNNATVHSERWRMLVRTMT